MKPIKILKLFFCIGTSNNEKNDKKKSLEIGEPFDFKVVQHVGLSNDIFTEIVGIILNVSL
jgi:hypothetical protein